MFRISFFVEDKNLAAAMHSIAGKAMNLEVVPVVNAVPSTDGKLKQDSATTLEMVEKEMRKRKLVDFALKDVREVCATLGFKPTAATYHVKKLIEAKRVKRTGTGPNTTYNLVPA